MTHHPRRKSLVQHSWILSLSLSTYLACAVQSPVWAAEDGRVDSAEAKRRFSEASRHVLRLSSESPSWSSSFQVEFQTTDGRRTDGFATTRYVLETNGRQSGMLQLSAAGMPTGYFQQGRAIGIDIRGQTGWISAAGGGFRFDCFAMSKSGASVPRMAVTEDAATNRVSADIGGFLNFILNPSKPVMLRSPFGESTILLSRAEGAAAFSRIDLAPQVAPRDFPIRRLSLAGADGHAVTFCRIKRGLIPRSILSFDAKSYSALKKLAGDGIREIPWDEVSHAVSPSRIRGELTPAEREVGLQLLGLIPIDERVRAEAHNVAHLQRQVTAWGNGSAVTLAALERTAELLRRIANPPARSPVPEKWAPEFDPSDSYYLVECNCGPVVTANLFAKLEATVLDASADHRLRAAALAIVNEVGLPVDSRLVENVKRAFADGKPASSQLVCLLACVQSRFGVPDEACIEILRGGVRNGTLTNEERVECVISLGLLGRGDVAEDTSSAFFEAVESAGPRRKELCRALACNWSGQETLFALLVSSGNLALKADIWSALSAYVDATSPIWKKLLALSARAFQEEGAPAAMRAGAFVILSRDAANNVGKDKRIVSALQSGMPDLQLVALNEVSSNADQFLPAISLVIQSTDPGVRAKAGSAIASTFASGRPPTPAAFDALAQMVVHDDGAIRAEATVALLLLKTRGVPVPEPIINALIDRALAAPKPKDMLEPLLHLGNVRPGLLRFDIPHRENGWVRDERAACEWLDDNSEHVRRCLEELAAERKLTVRPMPIKNRK